MTKKETEYITHDRVCVYIRRCGVALVSQIHAVLPIFWIKSNKTYVMLLVKFFALRTFFEWLYVNMWWMETPNEKIKMFFHLIFHEIEKIYRNILIFFSLFSLLLYSVKLAEKKYYKSKFSPNIIFADISTRWRCSSRAKVLWNVKYLCTIDGRQSKNDHINISQVHSFKLSFRKSFGLIFVNSSHHHPN